jgi:hypothetical protein
MGYLAFGSFSGRISQLNRVSRCCGGNSTSNPESTGTRRGSFALPFAGIVLLAAASLPAFAQAGPAVTTGRPTDWTHHHLVFSDPGPAGDERAKEHDSHLQDVRNSTRYALHQMRRDPSLRPSVSPGSGPRVGSTSTTHLDWSVNLSKGLVNPNTFPAKYSFNTNAYSCTSDYIVYPTGIAGSGTTQATILAYNELYGTSGPSGTGCGAGTSGSAVPKAYWAYNTAYPQGSTTADGSLVTTSPVLSLAGDQVVFIQVNSSGVASLVLLKWATSTSVVALDTATTNVTAANYRACTAPCMTRITLNGSPNDTWSAPFYEYYDDLLYVGDNSGKLHKFTNIFVSGTPAEVTSGYPVALGTVDLGSPIYDYTTGRVFVGSEGAVLYSVTGSTGAIYAYSKTLTTTHAHGIYDAPLVDSNAGKVYVFVEDTAAQTSGCTTAGYNCVYQFPTTFTGSGTSVGTSEPLGTGAVAGGAAGEHYYFSGIFDNIYYSSTNGTAGNLYVVGNINSTSGSLYRVPISSSGAMGTPVAVKINGTAPYPSPITEFCNNGTSACVASGTATTKGTDYIFFSVYGANETGCATAAGDGCVLAYNVSTGAPVFSSALPESYGTAFKCFVTGGIIVDNAIPAGTQAGASEIYFIGLGGTTANLCAATGTGSLTAVQSVQ